jgi:hypothetical protein
MKHPDIDILCRIAASLLADAATLRQLGCTAAAALLEEAERELDSHVYDNPCPKSASGGASSSTQH